jgi:O-antigen ligase
MFYQRPILGWGPGSYSFVYAPFQHSSELTIISTNSGNLGNAHSEYLGPLSETGVLGLLLRLIIIFITCITAIRIFIHRTDIPLEYRRLVLWVFLGLCTYWVHGFLNNFLDIEKAAIPYWGFVAIIVAIDLYGNKFEKSISKN